VIRANEAGAFSRVDLEVLFNALTTPQSAVAAYLATHRHEPVF
jgi:ABC-2 type transport system ATP-binding protein